MFDGGIRAEVDKSSVLVSIKKRSRSTPAERECSSYTEASPGETEFDSGSL